MIRTEKRIRLCYALLVLNLCFIWGNSLLPGSASRALSDWLRSILAAFLPMNSPSGEGNLLRKLAHFTEFACLGMCLTWLMGMLRRPESLVALLGIGAACVDETIQCVIPGRGPSLKDVGIDTCGVIVGMILLLLGHYLLTVKYSKGE